MAVNEEIISQFEIILGELLVLSGDAENTRIDFNLEVIDASPAAPLTNYVIVAGGPGGTFNGPALKVPGLTYTTGDKVNVIFKKGTEPVAMQQGSGSSGSNANKVYQLYDSNLTNVVLEADTTGNVVFNDSGADRDWRMESAINANAFFLQGSNGAVGLGTNAPVSILHTVGNTTIAPNWTSYGYGATPTVLGIQTNGTEGTPTATADGNNIWLWAGYGYETTTPTARLAAEIRMVADTPSGSSIPGGVVIRTHDSSLSAGITSEKFHMYPNGSSVFTADANADAFGTPMTNSSGAAVVAGDIGYMGDDGAFYTTTTANFFTENMFAVTRGGADAATIYVTKTALMNINYVGGDPSAGDYLVTSTTAGKATALLDISSNTYMSPEVVAVAVAAGSSNVVQARLLLNTQLKPFSSTTALYATESNFSTTFVGRSQWSGTIQALPGGAVIRYTTGTGHERTLQPQDTGQYAKVRLYNSTRTEYALIANADITGGGGYDGEITLTASVPGTWATSDGITILSQTNTSTIATDTYFLDLEIDSTEIPLLARGLEVELVVADQTTAGKAYRVHPWETNTNAKREGTNVIVSGVQQQSHYKLDVPLINRRFCLAWEAASDNSALLVARVRKVLLAAP